MEKAHLVQHCYYDIFVDPISRPQWSDRCFREALKQGMRTMALMLYPLNMEVALQFSQAVAIARTDQLNGRAIPLPPPSPTAINVMKMPAKTQFTCCSILATVAICRGKSEQLNSFDVTWLFLSSQKTWGSCPRICDTFKGSGWERLCPPLEPSRAFLRSFGPCHSSEFQCQLSAGCFQEPGRNVSCPATYCLLVLGKLFTFLSVCALFFFGGG